MAPYQKFRFSPHRKVDTRIKSTQTDFSMFVDHLVERFGEEFESPNDITDEVKANLMESRYKMGWPREVWKHEKSISPSPSNVVYGDDEELIEQQRKMEILRKQEKARKERQFEQLAERRKLHLERRNRAILPEHEAALLINTGSFLDKFREKSKWMERSLGINNAHSVPFDFTVKGSGSLDNDFKSDVNEERGASSKKDSKSKSVPSRPTKRKLLKFANKFSTEETANRAVGDMSFSTTNTDWFAASYFTENENMSITAKSENDGLILIWNLILPSCPEYALYSSSMITSTYFHPADQFLVFASTISGEILCYDLRNGSKSKPVQRTQYLAETDAAAPPLPPFAHCSPIYSMDFVQSASGTNSNRRHIFSVSNDGKMCIWKDDELNRKPKHEGTLQMHDKTPTVPFYQTLFSEERKSNITDASSSSNVSAMGTSTSSVAVGNGSTAASRMKGKSAMNTGSATSQALSTTCFGYQFKRNEQVLFGSDSGKLYRADIHSTLPQDEDKINVEEAVEAHFGPITNIAFPKFGSAHNNESELNFGRIPTSISGLYLTSSYDWTVKLWHSDYRECVEAYTQMTDYVYDVKWCDGGRPGVFACCDGDNTINVFDLKWDFKEPISTPIKVPTASDSECALTKLEWGNSGKYLSCGDSNGSVYLYITNKDLLYPQQRDFDDLHKSVSTLLTNRGFTKRALA